QETPRMFPSWTGVRRDVDVSLQNLPIALRPKRPLCRAAEGISSSQLWQPKCEEAVDESFFEERVRRPFINLSSTAAFVRQAFASNAVIVGRKVSKIGPGCMPTNQKVG